MATTRTEFLPTTYLRVMRAERAVTGTRKMLKLVSLFTFVLQSAAVYLVLRGSLLKKSFSQAPTALITTEAIKLVACMVVVYFEEGSMSQTISLTRQSVVRDYFDTLQVAIPPILSMIHVNFLYIGSTHLPDTISEALSQLDILTTAGFWMVMFNKKASATQWISLISLFSGVVFLQVAQLEGSEDIPIDIEEDRILGTVMILIACIFNGYGGVYFEKILKSSDVSVWLRAIQQSAVVLPVTLVTTLLFNYHDIVGQGFFYGYNRPMWCVILLQAFGNLLVGIVLVYSDSIRKIYASTFGIVVFFLISMAFLELHAPITFYVGTGLIVVSHVLRLKNLFWWANTPARNDPVCRQRMKQKPAAVADLHR